MRKPVIRIVKSRPGLLLLLLALVIAITGAGVLYFYIAKPRAPGQADPGFHPARFADLPGWTGKVSPETLNALRKSCGPVLNRDPDAPFAENPVFGAVRDWQAVCRDLNTVHDPGPLKAADFIKARFIPMKVTKGSPKNADRGLFTGYYEPSLNGSLTRQGPYQTPLRLRPDDLVMVNLGAFRDDLKGRRIAGRVEGGRLYPYETREEILSGDIPQDRGLRFVWVDDPVDAFFLQIQGSGRINLESGEVVRVGYAGQNGHPYFAIGRELIRRGALTLETVSLQSIREWLRTNPGKADEVMNLNRSYVFFQKLDRDGPLGGQGVVLTPGRSLAIDHSLFPYGVPVWVDIAPPVRDEAPIRRLMVTQDTGGAIRGAVRGDVFFGAGARARHLAGHMKSRGTYWMLVPKSAAVAADAQHR